MRLPIRMARPPHATLLPPLSLRARTASTRQSVSEDACAEFSPRGILDDSPSAHGHERCGFVLLLADLRDAGSAAGDIDDSLPLAGPTLVAKRTTDLHLHLVAATSGLQLDGV